LAQSNQQLHQRTLQLEDALTNVKVLRGLLPICASCKKIRDDQGFWNQVEFYLEKYSDAHFTHGICPECASKFFPDEFRPNRRENRKDQDSAGH
jgi:hypothetical protein